MVNWENVVNNKDCAVRLKKAWARLKATVLLSVGAAVRVREAMRKGFGGRNNVASRRPVLQRIRQRTRVAGLSEAVITGSEIGIPLPSMTLSL